MISISSLRMKSMIRPMLVSCRLVGCVTRMRAADSGLARDAASLARLFDLAEVRVGHAEYVGEFADRLALIVGIDPVGMNQGDRQLHEDAAQERGLEQVGCFYRSEVAARDLG